MTKTKRVLSFEQALFGGLGSKATGVLKKAKRNGVRRIPLCCWVQVVCDGRIGICCDEPANGQVRVSFGSKARPWRDSEIKTVPVSDIIAVRETRNCYADDIYQWYLCK